MGRHGQTRQDKQWYQYREHRGADVPAGVQLPRAIACIQSAERRDSPACETCDTDGWGPRSGIAMLNSLRWARSTRSSSNATPSLCGPGSRASSAAHCAAPRRNTCTILCVDSSSIATPVDTPCALKSTSVRHLCPPSPPCLRDICPVAPCQPPLSAVADAFWRMLSTGIGRSTSPGYRREIGDICCIVASCNKRRSQIEWWHTLHRHPW
jgi:hypothetical protein